MTLEGWVTLWIVLMWVSAGAFGLVALYVCYGYIRGLRKQD